MSDPCAVFTARAAPPPFGMSTHTLGYAIGSVHSGANHLDLTGYGEWGFKKRERAKLHTLLSRPVEGGTQGLKKGDKGWKAPDKGKGWGEGRERAAHGSHVVNIPSASRFLAGGRMRT